MRGFMAWIGLVVTGGERAKMAERMANGLVGRWVIWEVWGDLDSVVPRGWVGLDQAAAER